MPNTIKFDQTRVSCKNCSLSNLCLPHGLTKSELSQLDNVIGHKKQCSQNDYLYRNGDAMKSVYAVRSGSFKFSTMDSEGTEQVLGFYFPGDLIGLEGLGGQLHTCDVIAIESASVCKLSCDDLDALSDRIPNLRRKMMQLLSRELTSSHQRLLSLGKMNAVEKMSAFLTRMSNDISQRGFSSIEFNLSMTRHDLANYLGMASETVSRLLSRMQDDSLIAVNRRNVRILDMDALRNLAHEAPVTLHHIPLTKTNSQSAIRMAS